MGKNDDAAKVMKVQGDGSEIEVVQWKTNGDASESAMIKFVHSLRDIEEYRAKNPKCNDGKAEIPFNSANKYQVSVHDTPEGPVVHWMLCWYPLVILEVPLHGGATFLLACLCSHGIFSHAETATPQMMIVRPLKPETHIHSWSIVLYSPKKKMPAR